MQINIQFDLETDSHYCIVNVVRIRFRRNFWSSFFFLILIQVTQKIRKQTVNLIRTSGTKSFEKITQKNKLLFYVKWVRTTEAKPRRKCEIVVGVYDIGFSSVGDCGAYCLLRCGGLWSGRNLPTLSRYQPLDPQGIRQQ